MSYNNNGKRYGGEHRKGFFGHKYVEGNYRNTRSIIRDALKTFDINSDTDIVFNKFSPRATSAWLE